MDKNSKNINKEILKTIKYFSFFAYHPTLDEIHTFLTVKIDKKKLKNILETKKYTVGEYSKISQKSKVKSQKLKSKVKNSNETMKPWSNLLNKQKISKNKLNSLRFRLYIKLLAPFPQIKLVGLSGSIAMMNANIEDDIDLFIISAKNRLFTTRFLATILSIITGLKRRRGRFKAPNKVCLNLFFDESNLTVPNSKKTEFVAHEILQMKPLVNKDRVYERFLQANRWIFKLFPNAQMVLKLKIENLKFNENCKLKIENLGDRIEHLLKDLQLRLINRHRTTEIITGSQLWFHPVDFGKKLLRHSREGGNPG